MNRKMFAMGLVVGAAAVRSACAAESGYVAHEWGTFTSVQGSDGVQLQWRAAQVSELPKFVYNWNTPGVPVGGIRMTKGELYGRQRMETPVIYFYQNNSRTTKIKATVDFDHGLITEWYPRASDIGPAFLTSTSQLNKSHITWEVNLTEPGAHTPPTDRSGSHYFAARETGATLLSTDTSSSTNAAEWEKFLFYRGIGYFEAPLQVRTDTNRTLVLTNAESEPLKHLFVLKIKDGQGSFAYMESIKSSDQARVSSNSFSPVMPLSKIREDVKQRMAKALASEGLYADEAAAMVKTWADSWFTEEGTRVLYVIPRSWTDGTLPLKLEPKPAELVRVMVGRAEIISPEVEQTLRTELAQAAGGNAAARKAATAHLKQLGRFADPAMQLASKGLDRAAVNLGRDTLHLPPNGFE